MKKDHVDYKLTSSDVIEIIEWLANAKIQCSVNKGVSPNVEKAVYPETLNCHHCEKAIVNLLSTITQADGYSYKTFHGECFSDHEAKLVALSIDLSNPSRFPFGKPPC